MKKKISINSLKSGMSFYYHEDLYLAQSVNHVKTGRGQARVKVKCKNWKNKANIEITLSGADKIQNAFIEKTKKTFQYFENEMAVFMDMNDYALYEINKKEIQEELLLIVPGTEVEIIYSEKEFLQINLPPKINLKVIKSESSLKGNKFAISSSSPFKNVKIETGLILAVPIFINKGDIITVDTQTKKYDGRN